MRLPRALAPAACALALTAGAVAAQGEAGAARGGAPSPSKSETRALDTNEEGQPPKLPALPPGMTLELIRAGDSVSRTSGRSSDRNHCASGAPNPFFGLRQIDSGKICRA